jgi:hypothetical protein
LRKKPLKAGYIYVRCALILSRQLPFNYHSTLRVVITTQFLIRGSRDEGLQSYRGDAGALAFWREVPNAEIHLLNASHFALDEEVAAIAALMHRFLSKQLSIGI